jgi:hypothetical protein
LRPAGSAGVWTTVEQHLGFQKKNLDAPVPGRKGSRRSGIKPRKFSPADFRPIFLAVPEGLSIVLPDPS